MKKILFLIILIVIALATPRVLNYFNININTIHKTRENFDNYLLASSEGKFPGSLEKRELSFYPTTGALGISNNEASDIWWHYPTFKVGSYEQITNNIKYPNNPDEGTCMPASMCGALYKERQEKSNIAKVLPPVCVNEDGTRINYYNTDKNMLTFRNTGNILY